MAKEPREPDVKGTIPKEVARDQGVKVTISSEDGPRIVFFGGKTDIQITITSGGRIAKLTFSGEVDPIDETDEEDPAIPEGSEEGCCPEREALED